MGLGITAKNGHMHAIGVLSASSQTAAIRIADLQMF